MNGRSKTILAAASVLAGFYGCRDGAVAEDGIFRITPQRPVAELRREALAAEAPQEPGDFRDVDLVDLTTLDPAIKLDIRYATTDNFLSTPTITRIGDNTPSSTSNSMQSMRGTTRLPPTFE